MERPKLTNREEALLFALTLMRGWMMHYTAPMLSGRGEIYLALTRDMEIARKAIEEATGGNEE